MQGTAAISEDTGYKVEKSLRFEKSNPSTLTRTFSSAGNRQKFTVAFWAKLSKLDTYTAIFTAGTAATNDKFQIYWTENKFRVADGFSSTVMDIKLDIMSRDFSAWGHYVVAVDTTQNIDTERVKIYINGSKQESFASTSWPSEDANSNCNNNVIHWIGGVHDTSRYFSGYVADVFFIDGLQLPPAAFGARDLGGAFNAAEFSLPAPNDGTTWSSSGTVSGNDESHVSKRFVNLFDGSLGSVAEQNGYNTTLVWTPGTPIPIKSSLRIYYDVNGSPPDTVINDRLIVTPVDKWVDIDMKGETTLTKLEIPRGGSGTYAWAAAIEIDGKILEDGETDQTYAQWAAATSDNTNSFHLKFNNTSNLGKDSLKSNDWTSNDITAPETVVTTADSTGAKPILQTTGTYGDSTNDSANTDSNASKLLICLSGKSLTEVEPSGRTAATRTWSASGGANISTNASRFYGSSFSFDGADDYISAADSSDFDMGSNSFTAECWVYPTTNSSEVNLLGQWEVGTNSNCAFSLFMNNNKPTFYIGYSGNNLRTCASDTAIRQNGWSHIAGVYDGSNMKIYVNGTLKKTTAHTQGCNNGGPDFHLGAALENVSGSWQRTKELTGFMQDIRVYKDLVKYNSNFTVTNEGVGAALDVVNDSPANYGAGTNVRGNFCTLNPLNHESNIALTNGNLSIESGDNITGTLGYPSSGKWYYEYERTNTNNSPHVGIFGQQAKISDRTAASQWMRYDGTIWENDSEVVSGLTNFNNGDFVGVAVDMDAGTPTIKWYVNNTLVSTRDIVSSIIADGAIPGFRINSGCKANINFGSQPFKYSAPAGHKPLCTQNFDDTFSGDQLNNPRKYFNVIPYTGNGGTKHVEGTDFQPELVWLKKRSGTANWTLWDAARGVEKRLMSDTTDDEDDRSGGVTAFNSNGFTTGSDSTNNDSGETYISWLWDAGTAAATASTDGGITPSAQWVNATAGFSISKYSGSSGSTSVGHALGAKPDLVIVKCLQNSQNWTVYHKTLSTGGYLKLNSHETEIDYPMFDDSQPTNTIVPLGNDGQVSNSGDTYIMYAWTAIPGFSAFGEYVGNGNANGPFVYTGFRPALVWFKPRNGGASWTALDIGRDPENMTEDRLFISGDNADSTGTNGNTDFLSNGFKIRTSHGGINANAQDVIYCAWAEQPFKTARAK